MSSSVMLVQQRKKAGNDERPAPLFEQINGDSYSKCTIGFINEKKQSPSKVRSPNFCDGLQFLQEFSC